MPAAAPHSRRSLAGVMVAMGLVNLVYGITFPLLALVLDQQGVSKTLIGLNTMVQAVAIVAVAPFAARLLKGDLARVMQWSALGLALLFVLAGWFPNVWVWFPLRFAIGVLTALMWIASESLINTLTREQWRGRVVGIYAAVGSAGFALGPLLLMLTGSQGMPPFYATTAMVLISATPLFWVTGPPAEPARSAATGLWGVLRLAPVIMLANVVYAASAESLITFFPLFGMHLGLAENHALGLMTVLAVGGMVLVPPLGWVADRVNRQGLLAVCTGLTAAGLLLLPAVLQAPYWVPLVFIFVLGGVEAMIYALGVTLIGQRFTGAQLAVATTAFTTCWGVGTIIGPALAGAAMDAFGAGSLAWVAALFFLVYLPLPFLSWLKSASPTRLGRSNMH